MCHVTFMRIIVGGANELTFQPDLIISHQNTNITVYNRTLDNSTTEYWTTSVPPPTRFQK